MRLDLVFKRPKEKLKYRRKVKILIPCKYLNKETKLKRYLCQRIN